jgi:signal transduction histidine kinase
MEELLKSYIPLFVIIPLLMSSLSFLKFQELRKKQFLHLTEFFLAISADALTSWFFLAKGPAFLIISMIPWIWSLRVLGLVFEDLTQQKLYHRIHLLVLALGGLISLILLFFSYPLSIVVAPFSVCVGLIGLNFFFFAYQKGRIKKYTFLHHINFFFLLLFFTARLTFSIWVSHPERLEVIALFDGYMLLIYCATLYPLYAEVVFESREHQLEKVLQLRNKQLFSHSGFSEYKILSAGVSHEVNNALTIINAKIEQIFRGSSKDFEKDMKLILKSTNRIVKSMRGLREFIYPHEIPEKIEIKEVVDQVLSLYGQRLINHGVQIQTFGLEGKYVKGFRLQLEQIFLSFINNSVDAIDNLNDKWISIAAKFNHNCVDIIMQDSSESRVDELMLILNDPFTDRDIQDNGIRLLLVKDIIEKHGGQLKYPKQEYSTFIFSLPLLEAAMKSDPKLKNATTLSERRTIQ